MLGKQLWRLIEKPHTLFSRVLKGRYFQNASPLEPIRSYSRLMDGAVLNMLDLLLAKG